MSNGWWPPRKKGEPVVLVLREEAESIAKKAVVCIEDLELRGVVAGLLTREYYINKKLFQKHKEKYYK